jgi:hypothetical protein
MNTKIKKSTDRLIRQLALLGMAGSCLTAVGQDAADLETGEPASAPVQGAQPPPSVKITTAGSYQFKSDIDSGGDFSIARFRVEIAAPISVSDKLSVAPFFRYAYDSYDFGGGPKPWGDVNSYVTGALLKDRLNDNWVVYGGPILRLAAESGASWNNTLQGGGLLGVTYIMNSDLNFGGGLYVMSQVEDNATVLPIITANWKFAERWKAELGYTDIATVGYGALVTWDCQQDWQLSFGGQFHRSRFRIDGSGPSNDGIGQEQAFTLAAGLTWAPSSFFSATGFVGLATGGEIRLENSSGNELASSNYDPAPIIGLKAIFKF